MAMQGYRIFNTWTGDHTRLVTLEAVVKEIQEKNLLDSVKESGRVLLKGLQGLEVSCAQVKQCMETITSLMPCRPVIPTSS